MDKGGIVVQGMEGVVPKLREIVASGKLPVLQQELAAAAKALTYDVRGMGAVAAAVGEVRR